MVLQNFNTSSSYLDQKKNELLYITHQDYLPRNRVKPKLRDNFINDQLRNYNLLINIQKGKTTSNYIVNRPFVTRKQLFEYNAHLRMLNYQYLRRFQR